MAEEIILKNGLRVLLDHMPHVRSVCFGVYFLAGACDECDQNAGISHFVEHMTFKGTERRCAADIAGEFDIIGGQSNAYTSLEYTCYYVKTLDYHLPAAMDIIADMVQHSRFDAADMDVERGVILEEINMYEDSPEDMAVDRFFEGVWKGAHLGRNILGTRESLEGISPADLHEYVNSRYTAENAIISVAGSFERDELLPEIERLFRFDGRGGKRREAADAPYTPGLILRQKDCEQNHLCLGFPGLPYGDDDKYALAVMSNILGGGMSSRLFQKLREDMGLVYTVYSFSTSHRDAGAFGVYAACSAEAELKALELTMGEIALIKREGVRAQELVRSKELSKTSLLMGLESTHSRMASMARSALMGCPRRTPDEIIACIDRVDFALIDDISARILDFDRLALSVVGELADEDGYAAALDQKMSINVKN